MQRAVLEPEHQSAFKKIACRDHLRNLTVAHDVASKRSHEKKTMGYALRKSYRDGGGSKRRGDESGVHDEDCHAEEKDMRRRAFPIRPSD